jgi:hypothetical protein
VTRSVKALFAAASFVTFAAFAQPVHTGGGMATRSVSHYLALEREVQQAVAARDSASLQARVSGDFTYRTAASADVLDRGAWVAHEARRAPPVRDLTVSEQEGLAVVSFLAGTRFIVDTWKGDQLVARSASLAADAPRPPRRPSGRE